MTAIRQIIERVMISAAPLRDDRKRDGAVFI